MISAMEDVISRGSELTVVLFTFTSVTLIRFSDIILWKCRSEHFVFVSCEPICIEMLIFSRVLLKIRNPKVSMSLKLEVLISLKRRMQQHVQLL